MSGFSAKDMSIPKAIVVSVPGGGTLTKTTMFFAQSCLVMPFASFAAKQGRAAAEDAIATGATDDEVAEAAGQTVGALVVANGGSNDEAGRAASYAVRQAGCSIQVQAAAAGVAVERAGGSPADAGAAAAQAARTGGASAVEVQVAAGKAAAAVAVASGGLP